MIVNGGDNGGEEYEKLSVVSRSVARLEEVHALGGREGPVVVLAAAVDTGEWLFVQEADKTVMRGDFLHYLHRQLIVVDRYICRREDGRELVLSGRRLVVFGLCEDSELPELFVELCHERLYARLYCSEIVVVELLSLGRLRAEQRVTGQDEVGALIIESFVDEKIFLFRTDGGDYLFRVDAEELQHSDRLAADRFHRSEERRLLYLIPEVITNPKKDIIYPKHDIMKNAPNNKANILIPSSTTKTHHTA